VTAVDDFLAYAEQDRLRSVHTLARYRTVLAQLDDPLTVTPQQIDAWWRSRFDKSAATRSNELACLRSFYRWATRRDLRPDDPTRMLDAPKVDNAFPRPIGRSELAQAFTLCDERGAADLRRALALGAYGGLRVSEAAAIDWTQIDMEKRLMRIRGKGRKERLAAVSAILLDEILPDLPKGNIVCAGGYPYTADALQKRVNRLLVKVHPELSFHKLRARYVTQAINDTGDIYNVAKAVGWASIETAQHYAEGSNEALHRIAAAASR